MCIRLYKQVILGQEFQLIAQQKIPYQRLDSQNSHCAFLEYNLEHAMMILNWIWNPLETIQVLDVVVMVIDHITVVATTNLFYSFLDLFDDSTKILLKVYIV